MSNHLLGYGQQQASKLLAKDNAIHFELIGGRNKYMLYDMIIHINNMYFCRMSDTCSISNLTKIHIDTFLLDIADHKLPQKISYALTKSEPSYNGKNRDKQVRTYCKASSDRSKDLLKDYIMDNLILILDYQIKSKQELKFLLAKLCQNYIVKYNFYHEDDKFYVTPNMIKETLSSFLNYNDDKINEYLKKYSLKTSNKNDYALCLYNAINNKRMTELV